MTKYNILSPFSYPQLRSDTHESGYRVYFTPEGPAPSVTTILSSLPAPELDAWKKRVGEEEARRVSKEATTVGSYMHGYLENYLRGVPDEAPQDTLQEEAQRMANAMKKFGLRDLTDVWAIEEAVHCHYLYAGRTDLIGVYKGRPSIIDYKTSNRYKKPEWIHHYKLQTAAYAMAHAEMFGVDVIEQLVILIALRPTPYRNADVQRFIVGPDELKRHQVEWMDIIADFYGD